MNRILPLVIVALAILAFATLLLVAAPAAQITSVEPPEDLQPYTPAQARGRDHYVSLGCVYCHTQQPRDPAQGPDAQRGWGRPSTPADYVYDQPHQLGTMRTGPDLLNVGARLPSRSWQLTHLYQPRAITPSSLMPGFPFLFEEKNSAGEGDVVVPVPERYRPEGKVIVARQEALDLADYLLSLDRTYEATRLDLRDNGFQAEEAGNR
ncbi:cbb3-type cytochrome c oxidase subunit II [Halomonas korlensis]|uniref:Cytochrome c oxidase cbb3-type subunit 2 n=1 Tax=Halomonas korlensis TaxID=463301 RepID=A0A1I7IBK7_9GAMM|nr:cbb3-type cytochrome c oxidase subunit II [Halomonas korlensis]SFU70363.1 cytochrome c oxidase cbb3-type subunit 2 [Halomonas korlensis]